MLSVDFLGFLDFLGASETEPAGEFEAEPDFWESSLLEQQKNKPLRINFYSFIQKKYKTNQKKQHNTSIIEKKSVSSRRHNVKMIRFLPMFGATWVRKHII